jgi:hypothetical protein
MCRRISIDSEWLSGVLRGSSSVDWKRTSAAESRIILRPLRHDRGRALPKTPRKPKRREILGNLRNGIMLP